MADTYTTNLNLTKPEPGAAEDTWGISLNADLDSLDAIFSTSGTQINLNPNQINFADGKKLILGTGSDLQIYHDGSNSHVRDQGTGDILISASDKLIIRDTTDGAQVAVFDTDGAVSLNYGNSTKFATSSSGIDVTGTVTSDGFTVEGDATIKGGSDVSNTGATLQLESTETQAVGSGASISFKGDDGSGTQRVFGVIKGSKTSATSGEFNGGLDFFTRVTAEGNARKRLAIASNGDISFYDDTGTSQNLKWDASADSLNFVDLAAAHFGTGSDLEIYHDGTNSYLKNNNGDLYIRQNTNDKDVVIQSDNGSGGLAAYFRADGSTGETILYHYGSQKISTSSSGIEVTGRATADGLTSEGTLGNWEISDGGNVQNFTRAGANYIRANNASGLLRFETGGQNLRQKIASNGDISFYDDTGSTQGFFWDASAESLGIGTTSPSAALHISGTSANQIRLERTNHDTFRIGLQSAVGLGFHNVTDNRTDMMIKGDGNVGIGTSSPSATLEVATSATTDIDVAHFSNSNGAVKAKFHLAASTGDGQLTLYDGNNNADVLISSVGNSHINSGGNVGIGTASPARNLHVHASNFTDLHLTNDTTGATASDGTSFTAINSDIYLTNREAGNMVFQTSGSERARFLSGGAFLIGKTALAVNNTGLQFNGGLLAVTKDGGEPLILNRKTTDGVVADFRKDNTSVGNTRSFGGDLIIQTGITGLRFNDANDAIHPVIVNGSVSDGATDLGLSNARFKDLHLSGTGYFGTSVGIGTLNPSDYWGQADNLVVGGTGNDGITIKSAAIGSGRLVFTDTASSTAGLNDGGLIYYSHTSDAMGFQTDGDLAMTIDTTGNLLVGKTSANIGTVGHQLLSDSGGDYAAHTSNGTRALLLNRLTSDGIILDLRKDGSTGGVIGIQEPQDSAEELYIANGNGTSSVGLAFWDYINTSRIAPCNGTGAYQDNSIDLGYSGARFDDIYATNGTIQTSDRNEKQDIQALTDAEQRVATACKGLIRRFRWQDAVEEKGDDARLHFGVIAQDLQDAFTAEGLDAGDYGMFISSTWEDDDGVEQTRLGVRYNELLAFIITTL